MLKELDLRETSPLAEQSSHLDSQPHLLNRVTVDSLITDTADNRYSPITDTFSDFPSWFAVSCEHNPYPITDTHFMRDNPYVKPD